MRYQCEQDAASTSDDKKQPAAKRSLDNGQSGAHRVIVQSGDLSALVWACLAKCPCVFVPEGLFVSRYCCRLYL